MLKDPRQRQPASRGAKLPRGDETPNRLGKGGAGEAFPWLGLGMLLAVWLGCGLLLGWYVVLFSLLLLGVSALIALPWLAGLLRRPAQASPQASPSPRDGDFEATVFMADWKPNAKDRAVNAVYGLSRMLSRWATTGHQAQGELFMAQGEVDTVVAEAEAAALKISQSFRAILANNDRQTKAALALLGMIQPVEAAAPAGTLNDEWQRMARLQQAQARAAAQWAETAERHAAQQTSACASDLEMEQRLDALAGLVKQVSISTLGMGVQGGASSGDAARALDLLTARVRQLLDSAREVDRQTRRWLAEVRAGHEDTAGALQQAARGLRQSSATAQSGFQQAERNLAAKVADACEVVRSIHQLTLDNQSHINGVVVAMQFFDINSQKLQKLKHPLLSEVVQRLNALAIETRSLGRNFDIDEIDVPKVLREFAVVQPGARGAAPAQPGKPPARPAAAPAVSGEVELF